MFYSFDSYTDQKKLLTIIQNNLPDISDNKIQEILTKLRSSSIVREKYYWLDCDTNKFPIEAPAVESADDEEDVTPNSSCSWFILEEDTESCIKEHFETLRQKNIRM